ncbi:hypothetical protein D6C91_10201 [Aureobasidium pullulans]|uniref:Uncharacterized protein n=1 Tax=Aureobasidium pullulans TaxID=5580 RepID=A0A4S9SAR7_AURPU|nr:hypothetical protein D6C91_10201 [Aureobasidium pullulans]
MPIHTAFFCIGLMFDGNGAYQPILEYKPDTAAAEAWMKNIVNLKRTVNGVSQDKRMWTHRIIIAIRSPLGTRDHLDFAGQRLTRSPITINTQTFLCGHIPQDTPNHLGAPLTYGRHDCKQCQVVVLHANIYETADVAPINFLWQTAIWKQHRLTTSIIDCSDYRFALLNSSLDSQVQYLYDYKALPYLIIETYIKELLNDIGRAKRAEFSVVPPPTIFERFEHHIVLQHRCLAYIPFLCWLSDFDILVETLYACESCLRSCLIHCASILQATLIYANEELNHLNQFLHFELSFQNNVKLSAQAAPRDSCCDHCTQIKHMAYIAFSLIPLTIIVTLLGVYLPSIWKMKWIVYLILLAFGLHLILRHYIRITLSAMRQTLLGYITETRRTAGIALTHIARLLTREYSCCSGRTRY